VKQNPWPDSQRRESREEQYPLLIGKNVRDMADLIGGANQETCVLPLVRHRYKGNPVLLGKKCLHPTPHEAFSQVGK